MSNDALPGKAEFQLGQHSNMKLLPPLSSLLLPFTLAAQAPNTWHLLHEENADGGKRFARVLYSPKTQQHYLWGTGGKKPARNVYERYELESFSTASPAWSPAFPKAAKGKWTASNFPPFRIYGQSGPDGLKYDEGPRLQTVGGYNSVNRVSWWDFDGIPRPSPIHTFNMACYDSKRDRMLFYSDGQTFALDPATHSWTNLQARNAPYACKHVAWASLAYDPTKDRFLLFGGGLATNQQGGAPTWSYDCQANEWIRLELSAEPPLRCNAPIVYDPTTQSMAMFGGYNLSAGLNDTWVFDCKKEVWERKESNPSPPPMEAPTTVALGGGKVLVVGNDARKARLGHKWTSSAQKETWLYDIRANTWTPLDHTLKLQGYRWLTADKTSEPNTALLVAFGSKRQTYTFRYDPSAKPVELPGVPPGTSAHKYPEQADSLHDEPDTPKPNLQNLPPNTFVNANPPGLLISKTWSTAVMETDKGEVLYIGGGHSGYSGNDVARYSLDQNRWSLDQPPCFPPFLESTNAGIYGWAYNGMPFSQHTYLWYTYDPVSKKVVYLARPSIPDGVAVELPNCKIQGYNAKEHGYASWVYDPAKKKMHTPSFGRPFKNHWHLCVLGTPEGVFCAVTNELYRTDVSPDGQLDWQLVDKDFPKPPSPIKYHYEYQPLVHDTKRNRLIQLKGDKARVDVYARSLGNDSQWQLLPTTGQAAIGREAVYLPKHDAVLWLGDQLHLLDLATNQMHTLDIKLPKGLYGHECAFVHDPKRDVCVALIPEKFTGPMQTFLFRYEAE